MISQFSLVTLIIIVAIIAGLFFVLKSFVLPENFYKNQAKREEKLKDKISSDKKDKDTDAAKEATGSSENERSGNSKGSDAV